MKGQVKTVIFHRIKAQLKQELKKVLPGAEAQYKMAPGLRLRIKPAPNVKKAAVLILLYPYRQTLYTVFIRRPRYDGAHSGQISLPGGKMEKQDNNIPATALREAQEEIGIDPKEVEIIGELSQLHIPVTNMLVFPVVGYTDRRPVFRRYQAEVEELIETQVGKFFRPESIQHKTRVIFFRRAVVPFYNINGHQIWGATAMIMSEFLEVIKQINLPPL